MKYKAILFDMDGVILESEPLHIAAFQTTLSNHGKNLTEDQYKENFAGRTDKEGFERYFEFLKEEVDVPLMMKEKTKAYLQHATDQLQGYPGVTELIKDLSTTHRLALVTGSLRAEAYVALDVLGIADCFEVIVSADDISHSKPDPEGYQKAIKLLAVDKRDSVIVEDSPSGVKAGKAAGVDVMAVENTHSNEELKLADVVTSRLTLEMF